MAGHRPAQLQENGETSVDSKTSAHWQERQTGFFTVALIAIFSAAAGVGATKQILAPDAKDLERKEAIEQQMQMRASYVADGLKFLQTR